MSIMLCAHSELEKGKFPNLQKCAMTWGKGRPRSHAHNGKWEISQNT